jgi:hypothetical protein
MQKSKEIISFLSDQNAVSEEFTTLPALSIVMIGFALFILLLAQTYTSYQQRMEQLAFYHTADGIATKMTNPDCYFMRDGGLVDLAIMQNDTSFIQSLRGQLERGGITFLLRLHWGNFTIDIPEPLPPAVTQRVAVSKNVGIYLNEAQTVPGTLTVILWRNT